MGSQRIRKVVILNPMNYGTAEPRPPFGLLTISACFMALGVEVAWIDAEILGEQKAVRKALKNHLDADLIATGGLSSCYAYLKDFFTYLGKEKIGIPTIIGGRVAKDLENLIWEFIPNADMICTQEGEHVIESLVAHFPERDKVAGVSYRAGQNIVRNPPAPTPKDYSSIPPTPWELLSADYFCKPAATGYLLTGRGCPYRCAFCRRHDHPAEKYRAMPLERIVHEISRLKELFGIKRIIISDELFLQNKARVKGFCLAVRPLNISWLCTSRGDTIKPDDLELLRLMKKSGCFLVNMGLESGSQEMLRLMNKKLRLEDAEGSVNLVREAGLDVKATFIFGFPGETRKTALESVRWRKKMGLGGKFFYATPMPGSDLYEIWKRRHHITIQDEDHFITKSANLNDFSINLTDMPNWQFRALSLECMLRLNTLKTNYVHLIRKPFKRRLTRFKKQLASH